MHNSGPFAFPGPCRAPKGRSHLPPIHRRCVWHVDLWRGSTNGVFARANQYHPDIVFTHSHRKSVAYLDVQGSIQEERLVTDLYEKPTNTHQCLLPSSNHPPHVHRDLPYGLGIRIRTIVSEHETLEVCLNELSTFLWQRGYSASLVNSQPDRVRAKSRDSILNSSQHSEPARNDKRVPLVCTWNSRLPSLQAILQKTFPILQRNERLKSIFDLPMVSYRRPKNLRDILVHTKPARNCKSGNRGTQPGTHPCGSSSLCKTCAIVKNLAEVVTGGNTYTIRGHFNCQLVSATQRSGMLRSHTLPSPPQCMRALPRVERLAASREWTAPGVVPRQLSGTDGLVAHVCFPGHGPKGTCVRAKGHVDMSSEQEDKHFRERWKSWWPIFLWTRRRGYLSSFGTATKPSHVWPPGAWTRFASMRYMTLCFSGATIPAAAELPRVDVFVISRPGPRLSYPHFIHSFVFTIQDIFVLSAPFHNVVHVCLHPV